MTTLARTISNCKRQRARQRGPTKSQPDNNKTLVLGSRGVLDTKTRSYHNFNFDKICRASSTLTEASHILFIYIY
jgi:hypothetical protein